MMIIVGDTASLVLKEANPNLDSASGGSDRRYQ
jgi:hypothetical protein